jgi:Coenzyme PQQ synthesis protein D (PqqD)
MPRAHTFSEVPGSAAEYDRGASVYGVNVREESLLMADEISRNSVVVASKEQVSCDLGGEAAILNLKNSVYYGLDPVGARAWNLLQEPRSIQEVRNRLLEEFEVEPARCESDLLALLERMLAEGLIEIHTPAGT